MPTDQTATVTKVRPPIAHYAACDRDVYGRAVVWFMEGDPESITAANVRAFVRGWRGAGEPCDCLRLRVGAAEVAVRVAKLRWEASMTDVHAERVACAKAELARLRGMA
jgi:hypothetical protein